MNFVAFTVEPDYCVINYSCNSVTMTDGETNTSSFTCDKITLVTTCAEDDQSDCTISTNIDPDDYTDQNIPPGSYVVQVRGCATDAVSETCETTEITIELTDPCDPPSEIVIPSYVNQSYVLTKLSQSYVSPFFETTPSYCPLTYSQTITKFSDNQGTTD